MAKRVVIKTYEPFDYTYRGGNGNDYIASGIYNDLVIAGKGDDLIGDGIEAGLAIGSNDVFVAGKGDDTIFSYSGDDFIFAGQGDDLIKVLDIGNDLAHVFVDGGDGDDTLRLFGSTKGEWVRIADPSVEQVISVEGREITVVNVEMVYM